MSVHLRDEQRRLLPRWRESEVAASTPELASLPAGVPAGDAASVVEIDKRLREWKDVPSIATAADALASGFVLGAPEKVREPAEYLLAHAEQAARSVVELAHRVLGTPAASHQTRITVDAANHRSAIALLRARLIVTPRDPLAYVDLARRYAALGQTARAEQSVRAALALAPDSRFVLRSASRFFVHAGDAERAQDLLRRAPRTRSDPWLLAAEISAATVAGHESRFVRLGRDLATRSSLPPIHLTELAGALGTLEINAGNRRAARKLFRQAMLAPTENSLAQAQWASTPLNLEELPPVDAFPRAFEARALAALRQAAWDEVIEACLQWMDDEPFSHKSAALGSFAAATGLGDHERAVLLAGTGLTANPTNQILRNNLVYSLASLGRLSEAEKEATGIDVSLMEEDTLICWTATEGLLSYRLGNAGLGRQRYESAIAMAGRAGKPILAALAALNWAIVASQLSMEEHTEVQARALSLAERAPSAPVLAMCQQLLAFVASGATDSGLGRSR